MTRLKQSDFTAFSHALKVLYADSRTDTLSERVLAAMRRLFDCEFASFSLVDLRRGRWYLASISPQSSSWSFAETYPQHLRDDPVARHILRTRSPAVFMMSDFTSLREYRSSKLYAEVFRSVGCDRRLGFAVQGTSPVNMTATLNRHRRDFNEGERTLLNLLRPHLIQANSQAHADQLAVAARLAEPDRPPATYGIGLIELDRRGGVRWLSPRAETLLRTYFPRAGRRSPGSRLPGALERHVKRSLRNGPDPSAPLALVPSGDLWHFPGPDGSRLKVRLAGRESATGCQLVLEETAGYAATQPLARTLGLSPRQGEVLHWVAEGKTNRVISQILGISENTAGKHLEHILFRLQVPNRTAAVRAQPEARAPRGRFPTRG